MARKSLNRWQEVINFGMTLVATWLLVSRGAGFLLIEVGGEDRE